MMASSGSRVHPTEDIAVMTQSSTGASISKTTESSESYLKPLWQSEKEEWMAEKEEKKKKREEEVLFVRQHFHQKECRLFVPSSKQFNYHKYLKIKFLRCHCGETLMKHAGMKFQNGAPKVDNNILIPPEYATFLKNQEASITLKSLPNFDVKWSEYQCIQSSATNAFGRMDFNVEMIGGKKSSKYIRLSNDDSVDDCLELMKTHWEMMEPSPPSLVISVVGGAMNFQLDATLRDIFISGLIKAAKTTKAWLITSGGNFGVMKIVGEAVHKGQSFVWADNKVSHMIRCIGISAWGHVRGRQFLEDNKTRDLNNQGKFNAYYRTSTDLHVGQPVPINPYHTHFIFVDNGLRLENIGVTEFRASLEKKISNTVQSGGLGIPVVQVLLEGGVDAISVVSASVAKGIPVIVCAGSGRAANIFAYAAKHTFTNQQKKRMMTSQHQDKLARKIYSAFPPYFRRGTELEKKKKLEDLMNKVMTSCEKEQMINVFFLNKHEELDLAILSVLLKGGKRAASNLQNQLQLAMAWDRADIAQTKIFRDVVNWQEGCLENAFTTALMENKHQFVKVLLNNGVNMRDYLTRDRLQHLYNDLSPDHYMHRILKMATNADSFHVDDICSFLTSLLDKYEDNKISYEKRAHKIQRSPMRSKSISKDTFTSSLKQEPDSSDNYFERPFKQLLLWAVLTQRNELGKLFWELGDDPIMSALIVTKVCKGMALKVPKFLQTIQRSFLDMKLDYEKLAINVLDECHKVDPGKALKIVERPSPCWSQMTCLQVATAASDNAFVSSVACQNFINNVWKRNILSHWPKVFLSCIFPPLIVWSVTMAPNKGRPPTNLERIIDFYSSPLPKFAMFTGTYAVFLAVFSYMLLVDFRETPSASEWVCVLWIASYFIGAVHALVLFPSPTIGSKFRDYFGIMDRLDLFNMCLALAAFCVRWINVYDGKVIYCVNAMIFYMRLMKLYTGNRSLGPKIYMIQLMVAQLIMFVMVLMVFLLAYGVASQGLLYKHRNKDWVILKDILYFPYWQLYGEIFLDEIETDDVCTDSLSTKFNGTVPDADNICRTYHPLVPILLAFYLLVGNILLLSILIAIFSHVFDSVQKNSIEIWKFQMYFLVMEFLNRPTLPPPLCIFSYIAYAIRWVYYQLPCKKSKTSRNSWDSQHQFLSLFEKEMMANMIRNMKIGEMNSVTTKLDQIEDRLEELTRVVEEEMIGDNEAFQIQSHRPELETQESNKSVQSTDDFQPELPVEKEETEEDKTEDTPFDDLNLDALYTSNNDEIAGKSKHEIETDEKKIEDRTAMRVNETLNIHVPGIGSLNEMDSDFGLSDDANKSPQSDLKKVSFKQSPHSPTVPPPSYGDLGDNTIGTADTTEPSTSNYQDIEDNSPPPQRPGIRRRISKRMMDPVSDSDEDMPIPVHIYSPKAAAGKKSEGKDVICNSSDEERVVTEVRSRIRKHISRRRFDPNLDDLNL